MSYIGPWRNRLRMLYMQYCYLDELEIADPKLARILSSLEAEKGSQLLWFDSDWQYGKAKHRTAQRQVVWRQPLWMKGQQTDRFAEHGDKMHRKNGQQELALVLHTQLGKKS